VTGLAGGVIPLLGKEGDTSVAFHLKALDDEIVENPT